MTSDESDGRLAFRSSRSVAGRRPLREQVLDVLDDLGVPASPRVISDVGLAGYGYQLPSSRLASLRRDEERAWRKAPSSRPAWVVPALGTQTLTALPRIVTSSAWPMEQRLIGARTLRTIHLHTLVALLALAQRGGEEAPRSASLKALIASFAQSVPGALTLGDRVDPVRIHRAAEVELELIEPSDLDERRAAARRAERLAEGPRLWGQPALIEGGAPIQRELG